MGKPLGDALSSGLGPVSPIPLTAVIDASASPKPLVALCLEGSQAAMAELVETFRNRVFLLCFRMLGQRQDAEDVVQETFHRALRSLAGWDPTREFEPWLLAIAGNRCRTLLGYRAKRGRAVTLSVDVPDERPAPSHGFREELELALQSLRQDHRRAFVMFHVQQKSYQEISAELRVPVSTAKTWVHRARLQLAAALRAREVDQGA